MKRLIAGSAGLVVAMMVVNAANYGLNIFLVNALEPSEFGDASLLVTVLLIAGIAAATVQLATSVAVLQAPEVRSQYLRSMRLFTNRVGWFGGLLLAIASPLATDLLQVESRWALLVMALGFPLHLQLAAERGRLQGDLQLGNLALTSLAEGGTRVLATLLIVSMGLGIGWLAVALNLGFLGGYLVCRPRIGRWAWLDLTVAEKRPSMSSIGIAVVGITLITNLDVVVAKGIFEPSSAGSCAAVALGGRVVFFASWTLQQALLPLVLAEQSSVSRRVRRRLFLVGNAVACVVMVAIAWIWDDRWIEMAFGSSYAAVAPLFGPYAIGTGLVSIAAAFAVVSSAEGNNTPGRILLLGALVSPIAFFYNSETVEVFVNTRLFALAIVTAIVGLSGSGLFALAQRLMASCRPNWQGVVS